MNVTGEGEHDESERPSGRGNKGSVRILDKRRKKTTLQKKKKKRPVSERDERDRYLLTRSRQS